MSLVSIRAVCIIVLLAAVLFRLPYNCRSFLILASGLFFLADSPDLLVLHAAHTVLTLTLAFLMCRFAKARKSLLLFGILAHCLALIWLHGRGGFSFAALIHIGFLLDIGRSGTPGNIMDSAAALTFFPCLQEGPIIDALSVREQLPQSATPSWVRCSRAVYRIVAGLVKKLVIADRFVSFVDAAYSSPLCFSTGVLWLAMLAYSVQIYMDFSGCMDIVLGASALIGIDLPENFRRPYLADSFSEYWRRWHITMGAWFKRRFFYPLVTSIPMLKLAGRLTSRSQSNVRTGTAMAVPLLLTWTLVGLWHGPESHYVLWGTVNGMLILFERVFCSKGFHLPKAVRIAWTFLVMSLTRVLFRAGSLKDALQFYSGLFRFTGGSLSPGATDPHLVVAVLIAVLFFMSEIHTERNGPGELSVSRALILATIGIAAVLIFGCYGPGYSPVEFYYSRF